MRGVAVPGCSAAVAAGRQLPDGLTRLSPVPGSPFGVAVTADGRWSFVSLMPIGSTGAALGAFADTGAAGPRLVRRIPVSGQPLGVTLTPDGRYLLAANGNGASVISVQAAEQGSRNPVLGTLASGGGTGRWRAARSRWPPHAMAGSPSSAWRARTR